MHLGDRSPPQHTNGSSVFEVFLKKNLDFQDLTMGLDTIKKSNAEENLLSALKKCRNDRILNPCYVTVKLIGKQNSSNVDSSTTSPDGNGINGML